MFSKRVLFVLFLCHGCASTQTNASKFPALVEERFPSLSVRHFKQNDSSTETNLEDLAPDTQETKEERIKSLLSEPLTAQAATQIAILNSPVLAAELEDIGIAEGQLLDATLLANPGLAGSVLFQKGRKNPYLGFEISQNISSIIFRSDQKTIGKARLEAAHFKAAEDVLSVIYQVEQSYYRYLASQEKITLLKQVVLTAQASFEMAEQLFSAGNLKELDLKNQHILFEETKLLMLRERAKRFRNRETLNQLMGLRGKRLGWKILPRIPQVPNESLTKIEQAMQTAKKNNLRLGELNAQYKMENAKMDLAQSQSKVPQIQVGISVAEEAEGWRYGPTFELGLPLLNQNQGQIGIAKAKREQAKQQYKNAAIETQTATRTAHFQLSLAKNEAELLQNSIVPLRKQALEQAQRQYNAMTLGVFELLQFKRAEIETSLKQVEAAMNYWLARAAFNQILAGRIVGTDTFTNSTMRSNLTSSSLEGNVHD